MTQPEIYRLLCETFGPFMARLPLDLFQRTELDGLLDEASRKIAARVEERTSVKSQ